MALRSLIGGNVLPADKEATIPFDDYFASSVHAPIRYIALYFCEIDDLAVLDEAGADFDGDGDNYDESDFVLFLIRQYKERLKGLGVEMLLVPKPSSFEGEGEDDDNEIDNERTDDDEDNKSDPDSENEQVSSAELKALHRYRKRLPFPCISLDEPCETLNATNPFTSLFQFRSSLRTKKDGIWRSKGPWQHAKRLFNRFRIASTPSIVLLDADTGATITREAAEHLRDDPECESFPWVPRDVRDILQGDNKPYLSNKFNRPPLRWDQAISRRYVGILFSAGWCSTEMHSIHLLEKAFSTLVTRIDYDCEGLDVVFVSVGGHDDAMFSDLFSRHMPREWFAVDPQQQQTIARELQAALNVGEFPSLVLVDTITMKVVHPNAFLQIECEAMPGELFPWSVPSCRRFSVSSPPVILDSIGSGDDETVLFVFTDTESDAREVENALVPIIEEWRGENRLEGAQHVAAYVGDMNTPFVRQLRWRMSSSTTSTNPNSKRRSGKPFAVAVADFGSETYSLIELDRLELVLKEEFLRAFVESWLDGHLKHRTLREVEHQQGNCPGGHGLRLLKTRTANYRCDICGEAQPEATEMYSCRTCNYDECVSCHNRIIQAQEEQEERDEEHHRRANEDVEMNENGDHATEEEEYEQEDGAHEH